MFESMSDRMKSVIDEVTAAKRMVVLFLDELHTVIGAGSAEGAPMDAASMLKPALARGDLQIIGATTIAEYRRHIEEDAALERRFQPIVVDEPSVAQTVAILLGLRERYERHHRVRISDSATVAAAEFEGPDASVLENLAQRALQHMRSLGQVFVAVPFPEPLEHHCRR